MTEIRFYHLMRKKTVQALPEILGKALTRHPRIVVKTVDDPRAEELDEALWVYDPLSFLPHDRAGGHKKSQETAGQQPVWITAGDENPNGATMLVLTDGAVTDAPEKYDMCCEIFEDGAEDIVKAARARWKTYKEKGFTLTYFQQDAAGKWTQK